MKRFRWNIWILMVCIFLFAALNGVLAEEEKDSAPVVEENEGGYEVISPAYPVPDHVKWLLEIAQKELGYCEDSGKNTKYGVWAGKPDAEWCAEFLCWCVNQVDEQKGTDLLEKVYPKYFSSNVGRDWFLREGRYVARKGFVPEWGSQWYKNEENRMEKNSYIPQPGDWMFFSTSSSGDTTHVAMVEYCSIDENRQVYVHVIEGNNPDRVARKVYPLDNWAILGYGTVHDVADITLKSGTQGKKVVELQEKLALLGYLDEQYVTGKFATITAKAVSGFQQHENILDTGVAGQTTQLRLDQCVTDFYDTHSEYWTVTE